MNTAICTYEYSHLHLSNPTTVSSVAPQKRRAGPRWFTALFVAPTRRYGYGAGTGAWHLRASKHAQCSGDRPESQRRFGSAAGPKRSAVDPCEVECRGWLMCEATIRIVPPDVSRNHRPHAQPPAPAPWLGRSAAERPIVRRERADLSRRLSSPRRHPRRSAA